MTLDVVNADNQKVGSVDLSDEVFKGPVKKDLIWESVVRENAAARRGTHAGKNRALVSGGGKKPYRQKGTGRPQVGSSRTPLWRHGGTVFGPQPRSYAFTAPKKVELGGLQAALAQKAQDGALIIVDALSASEVKTRTAATMLKAIGVNGKALLVDVQPDERLALSVRNIPRVKFLASSRITARDVIDTAHVVLTQTAVEKLQSALGA
jgi:large subunit ribosomal protein L4